MNWNNKHRPNNFSDIVGMDETLQTIESFILTGNTPHLLFHGKPGTGKTTTAEIIGKKLLGDYYDSNFIEINASDERDETSIKKRVIKTLKHKPIGSSIRIIFLDEADGLKPTAQDLLKRPMEKTTNTLFILACNDIKSIIEPIQSRCVVFQFEEIDYKSISSRLKQICAIEKTDIDDIRLSEISKKCKGDVRCAINELQKVASINHRNTEIDNIVKQYMAQASV